MITKFFDVVELSCSRIDDRSIGFGMNISLCLPKICRKILSMEVLIAWNVERGLPHSGVWTVRGSCNSRRTASSMCAQDQQMA